jgi:hypothetical protein
MRSRLLTGLLALILLAGYSRAEEPLSPPPSVVTRAEAIATAVRYVEHAWTGTAINAFHGVDEDGIHMDTPEEGFFSAESDSGWWRLGETNIGIPYMWGGFDTPESFDVGLRAGKAAGDMYSSAKRRALDDGVSRHAVGIDCSGFVSRCWNLPRSFSTRELAALCDPVTDLSQLKPGDIFNKFNAHVVLFLEWLPPEEEVPAEPGTDAAPASASVESAESPLEPEAPPRDPRRIRVYEAGGAGGPKVQMSELPLQDLLDRGFSAWRYRGMREE